MKLEIATKSKPKHTFAYVGITQIFYYNDNIVKGWFMKIIECRETGSNAVKLINGEPFHFDDHEEVEDIRNATIIA